MPSCDLIQFPGASNWTCEYPESGFGDFNGDGKTDFVYQDVARMKVSLSDGTSLGSPQIWVTVLITITITYLKQPLIGDVNGDGLDDFVYKTNGGFHAVFSTGSSFDAPVFVSAVFPYCPTFQIPISNVQQCQDIQGMLDDLDGDGRADLVTLNEFLGGPELTRIRYSKGNTFEVPIEVTGPPTTRNYSNYSSHDINGDGLKDLITFDEITGGNGSFNNSQVI